MPSTTRTSTTPNAGRKFAPKVSASHARQRGCVLDGRAAFSSSMRERTTCHIAGVTSTSR